MVASRESGMEREWKEFECVRTIRAREMIMCGCVQLLSGVLCVMLRVLGESRQEAG